MDLHGGKGVPADILLEQDGPVGSHILAVTDPAHQLIVGKTEKTGQLVQGQVHRPGVLEDDAQVEGRSIVHQQAAVPIENQPAGRVDALESDAVVFRNPPKLLPFDDLQLKQAQKQQGKGDKHGDHQQGEPLPIPVVVRGFQISAVVVFHWILT